MREIQRIALLNPAWAPKVELIRHTSWGGYAATTLWGCTTRKYHSYLSLWRGGQRHELIPQMEEEVRTEEGLFRLTTQYWRGELAWEGYRYLEGFQGGLSWTWTYRIGRLVIHKQLHLAEEPPIWSLSYEFAGEGFPVLFRWTPLWAVRPWHAPCESRAQPPVRREGERWLFPELELGLDFHIAPSPRWVPWGYAYEGIFYPQEAARGYAAQETLQATELCEWRFYQPAQVLIQLSPKAISLPVKTSSHEKVFSADMYDTLSRQAENFFLSEGGRTYIIAGHPWFGIWGRDTFISLPGLTLARDEESRFHAVCESFLHFLTPDGRLPETVPGVPTAEDTGLWWLWALLQYTKFKNDPKALWKRYGEAIQAVLVSYLHRLAGEDGLLRVPAMPPPSWMDAVVDGKPAVRRAGALVDLNALWYAALQWVSETAPEEGVRWRWGLIARRVLHHYKPTFWQKNKGYLADCVENGQTNWQIRPNQLWAAAVPYRPISEKIAELVVRTIEKHLLTPRGLRTLSPADPAYQGTYEGDQRKRDLAYHNGTVWPFLLGAYADALFELYSKAAFPIIKRLYEGFAEALWQYGWGYIAEIYDGDAPHAPKGTPAQAWSVAELLRTAYLLRL